MLIVMSMIENDDDRQFMEDLFTQHLRIIYSTAKKYASNQYDAEEVIQDAMIKLIDKIPVLRNLNRCTLPAYVVITIRNTALNKLGHAKSEQNHFISSTYDELECSIDDPSIEDMLIRTELRSTFMTSWNKLDESTRELLERKYILCQSDLEIAKKLNVKPDSIRMMLTRARRKASELMLREGLFYGKQKGQDRAAR